MSDNRQSFSDRNSWHFAVAKSFPGARATTKVLTEARIVDGAEIAEWDFVSNTGWMRSIVVPQAVPATDGHAGYLGEGETAKPAWYIVGSAGVNMTSHTSKPSFPDADAARAYIKTFSHAPGFKSAKVVFGTSDKHGFITPVAASGYLGEGAKTALNESSRASWYVCEANPDDSFTAVDVKAYPSKDAAYASPVFRRDNGSRDIIAVHGVLASDKKTVTPSDLSEALMGGDAGQAKTALDEAAGSAAGRFIVYDRDVKTAIAVVTDSKDVATAWAVDHFKSSAVGVIAASSTAELKAAGVDAKFFKASRTDTVITKAKAAALTSHRSADAATYSPPNLDIAKSTPFPAVIVLGEWTTQPGDILNHHNVLLREGVMVRNTVEKVDGKVVGVEIDPRDVWNEWVIAVTAGGKKVKWRADAVSMPAIGWSWPDRAGRQVAKGSNMLVEAAGADKIDWNVGKGDWVVAKREGARIFADYNKPGNTDAVLAVKTAAAAAQKKGSYLGAVILGLANDYFERQR